MGRVLKGLQWPTLLLYLNSVIMFFKDFDSHIERLAEVCQRLRLTRLQLQPEKGYLFQREIHYLGHLVSQHGVATASAKIQTVKE